MKAENTKDHSNGFDISSSSFPPEEWLPNNVSLGVWNVVDEPPKALQERYDVVHIRLFLVVIEGNDPLPVLRHCLKILSTSYFAFLGPFNAILPMSFRTWGTTAMGRI